MKQQSYIPPGLVAQLLASLEYAVALKRMKWSICNTLGQRLIDHRIDELRHDLERLGAGKEAREVIEG